MYEQFNGFSTADFRNSGRNWQAHVLGIRRLLELLGPHAFIEERAFCIFQTCQNAQFTAAFAARKATPLANRQWRTIPWTGREKRARDLFFDIAFSMPTIVEQAELLTAADSDDRILENLNKLHELMTRLEMWKALCGARLVIVTLHDKDNDTGLQDPMSYSLSERETILLFAAVMVHASIVMHRTAALLSAEAYIKESPSLPNPSHYALWITEAIPTITLNGGIVGHQNVLFPMGALRWYMANFSQIYPDVTALLAARLKESAKSMGYMKFMDGFLKSIPSIRTNAAIEIKSE
jgi:hypothetical protein